MKLDIGPGKPGKGSWADAEKLGEGEYRIVYHKSLKGLKLAILVFHEMLHVWCWQYLPFQNIDFEHKFIRAMEQSLTRQVKKHWVEGK